MTDTIITQYIDKHYRSTFRTRCFFEQCVAWGLCGLGRYVFESDRERHAKYPVIITILAQPAVNV